jgi:hypothetical protein
VLDYRGAPEKQVIRPPDGRVALALCAPGAACWFILLTRFRFVPITLNMLWVLWGAAVLTAIVSLFKYVRFDRRTLSLFVVVNLLVNIPGLIFTLLFWGGAFGPP